MTAEQSPAYGLRDLQREIGLWHAARWPGTHRDPMYILTKTVEELGEVAECLVKRGQDHPKAAEIEAGLPGELLDVFVCLMVLCHREGIDLDGLAQAHVDGLAAKRRQIEAALTGPSPQEETE